MTLIPVSQSQVPGTCTHTNTRTQDSIVRQVCQDAKELQPTLTASANRRHSALLPFSKPYNLTLIGWNKTGWHSFSKNVQSNTIFRLYTYTNLLIKLLLRASRRGFQVLNSLSNLSKHSLSWTTFATTLFLTKKRFSWEILRHAHIQADNERCKTENNKNFYKKKIPSLFKLCPYFFFFISSLRHPQKDKLMRSKGSLNGEEADTRTSGFDYTG